MASASMHAAAGAIVCFVFTFRWADRDADKGRIDWYPQPMNRITHHRSSSAMDVSRPIYYNNKRLTYIFYDILEI